MAPARVPQEIMAESFHHRVPSPSVGMISLDTRNVRATETTDVTQTSEVRGCSKFISSEFAYFALATVSLMKYETALETSIMMRMTKIHTSSCIWWAGSFTPKRIKVISATPVTP